MKYAMMKNTLTIRKNHYYLMRHGESHANKNGLIISQPENALYDYGLTAKGADQVMKAALNTRLNRKTIIVSSDYKRALETAEIMHSVIDSQQEIIISKHLRERDFGNFELSSHDNYQQVWQHDLGKPDDSTNNVESVVNTLARSHQLLDELDEKFSDEQILLVGHGDVLQILLTHHHNINPRFHRSLSSIANADIRSLSKLDLNVKQPAA